MKKFFRHLITINAAALVALFTFSCSNNSSETAEETRLHQETSTSTNGPVKDLGVVELTEHTPKRLNLGAGKECVVTATPLADGNLQLVFVSKSKNADGIRTTEQTITATQDRQLMGVIQNVEFILTPTLKTK